MHVRARPSPLPAVCRHPAVSLSSVCPLLPYPPYLFTHLRYSPRPCSPARSLAHPPTDRVPFQSSGWAILLLGPRVGLLNPRMRRRGWLARTDGHHSRESQFLAREPLRSPPRDMRWHWSSDFVSIQNMAPSNCVVGEHEAGRQLRYFGREREF